MYIYKVHLQSFVVIGDYGLASSGCEGQVAELVSKFEKQVPCYDRFTAGPCDNTTFLLLLLASKLFSLVLTM